MSNRYGVKEIFLTLQGEGTRAGTKAVFVRFTGCNLWNGSPLHRDRGDGACAKWCDTDFFKGAVIELDELLEKMGALWPPSAGVERWCVLTGGEPCLQIDEGLMTALHAAGWKVAIETNGSVENDAACDADHICWAPKLGTDGEPIPLALTVVHEVKVVLPGAEPGKPGWSMVQLLGLETASRDLWPAELLGYEVGLFVQPQDPIVAAHLVLDTALVRETAEVAAQKFADEQTAANRTTCVAWVMAHPSWRLSLQTHKIIGVP